MAKREKRNKMDQKRINTTGGELRPFILAALGELDVSNEKKNEIADGIIAAAAVDTAMEANRSSLAFAGAVAANNHGRNRG